MKTNKPRKRALVAQETNGFIGLHVYVSYTIVQQALSLHGCVALLTTRNKL